MDCIGLTHLPIAQFFLIFLVFYFLLKAYARLAIHLYCTKIVVNKKEMLQIKGPVLFAANHPNSFLDGVILSTLLDETLYSLTRGDVFQNNLVSKTLSWLKLIPIYRTSEGTQNLAYNYNTFSACHQVFKKKKIVLIFSEAGSVNEWKLRPLRKGTARLAFSSWQQGIDVKLIPVAFNYDSFRKFGKELHLNFGTEIKKELFLSDTDGKQFNDVTQEVQQQLQSLIYDAKTGNDAKKYFYSKKNTLVTALLLLPGVIGWLVHAPLFYTCRLITEFRFRKSDHYDSVLMGMLLLSYPFYILLSAIIAGSYELFAGLLVVVLFPLPLWCWLQVKHLFQ